SAHSDQGLNLFPHHPLSRKLLHVDKDSLFLDQRLYMGRTFGSLHLNHGFLTNDREMQQLFLSLMTIQPRPLRKYTLTQHFLLQCINSLHFQANLELFMIILSQKNKKAPATNVWERDVLFICPFSRSPNKIIYIL